jgi:hypothetical protein
MSEAQPQPAPGFPFQAAGLAVISKLLPLGAAASRLRL